MVGGDKHLVILDWDSTLFDLLAFVAALPPAAEAAFGIYSVEFKPEISRYYAHTESGERIGYDIYAHFAAHGVDLNQKNNHDHLIAAVLAAHRELTGRNDFLFNEVPGVVKELLSMRDTHTTILTVNVDTALKFKYELTGNILDGLPIRVVSENKGRVLAAEWADNLVYGGHQYDTAVIVDDSAAQIEAVPDRPDVTRLQIVRPGQKYPANTEGIRIIGSLKEVLGQA